ncbi:MAG: hypothetical protein H6981_04525 [Gammaproteobacteria bacterium]|nr:hypothetical protein [Gammaproteobacteria bacterium]
MSRCDHPQAWFEEGQTAGAAGAGREVDRVHREPRDPRHELVGRVALAHLREVLR